MLAATKLIHSKTINAYQKPELAAGEYATEVPSGYIGIGEAFQEAIAARPSAASRGEPWYRQRAIEFCMRKAFTSGKLPVLIWNGHEINSILIAADREQWYLRRSETFGKIVTCPHKWQDVLYGRFPVKYADPRNPTGTGSRHAFFLDLKVWRLWLSDFRGYQRRPLPNSKVQAAVAACHALWPEGIPGIITETTRREKIVTWCKEHYDVDALFNISARVILRAINNAYPTA